MSIGTVLVADDEPDILDLVQMALEDLDYHVLTAADGVDALDILARQPVDVILLDIRMPRMDGLEVTEHLRANPATEDIPIILMSAHRRLQGTSTLLPINGRLPKPFLLDDLARVVARWMPGGTAGRT